MPILIARYQGLSLETLGLQPLADHLPVAEAPDAPKAPMENDERESSHPGLQRKLIAKESRVTCRGAGEGTTI